MLEQHETRNPKQLTAWCFFVTAFPLRKLKFILIFFIIPGFAFIRMSLESNPKKKKLQQIIAAFFYLILFDLFTQQ